MSRLLTLALVVSALAGSARAGGPTTFYVAPTGSDANACTQTAPCATIDRAQRVAQPGDIIELADGSYGSQTIKRDVSKLNAAQNVLIRPAAGAHPTFVTLALGRANIGIAGPHHLTITGIRATNIVVGGDSSNTIIDGVTASAIIVGGSQDVQISHSDIGSCDSALGPCSLRIWPWNGPPAPGVPTANIRVIDNVVHDILSSNYALAHVECMFLRAGVGVTISGNTFSNCDIYDIFVQTAGSAITNVTVENNILGRPLPHGSGCLAIGAVGTWSNWTVRFNTCRGVIRLEDIGNCTPNTYVNFTVVGNLGGVSCYASRPGLAWRHNVWTTQHAPLGTDKTGMPPSLIGATTSTSPWLDFVPLTDGCPPTDFDGDPRPSGVACDAGADELSVRRR